jgi:hypothetical protein
LSNIAEVPDFGWSLVAASCGGSTPLISTLDNPHTLLLDSIKRTYASVKLANFNEADALSIYHVFAAHEALNGRLLLELAFERSLAILVQEFPSELFKLSKRRGRGLYIALKR